MSGYVNATDSKVTGPSRRGLTCASRALFGEDRLVERLAQAPPRHAHVEELVVEGRDQPERSGGGRGQERHRRRGADAQILLEHEPAGAVEDEGGGHRAEELDERRVGVLDGDGPPARPPAFPARFDELLGLDGVGAEVADLVAGAEVFLELPGDHAELVTRPRQRPVREGELHEGDDDDDPDECEYDGQHRRRQDDDRSHGGEEDHRLAGEPERRILHEGEDPVEVGDHAGGDVAGELAVVVVHAELGSGGRTPGGGARRSRSG